MKWFEKTIPEAIQLSKEKGSLFIVYIYGTDELSEQMNTSWDAPEVTTFFEGSNAVSVRISNESDECKFFSQIYPVCVIPSIFCIGEGGVPLEVIGGHVPGPELVLKLQAVEQVHYAKKSGVASQAPATGATPTTAEATPTTAQASSSLTTTAPDEPVPMDQGAAPQIQEEITPVASSSSSSSPPIEGSGDPEGASAVPLDVKVQRAKELLEEKKRQKEKESFEKRKLEEIERRKLGQGMSDLKKYQQEMDLKEVQQQLKKDKEEEKRAKEKIRAQIARDREERQARFQKEKKERDAAMEEGKRAKLQEQQRLAAEQEARRSECARIQVRLPDASAITETFPSTEPLQTLYNFVTQRVGSRVYLSTTFPRRRFTEEDMSSSLADLQLAPSAVVIALPDTGRSSTGSQVVSTGGIFSWIMVPFTFLWSLVMSLLGTRQPQTPPPSQSSQPPTEETQTNTNTRTDRPKSAYQRRTPGNMRRMADVRDDDEDMTTYNGNSTQQL